jgi:hypothetical protein
MGAGGYVKVKDLGNGEWTVRALVFAGNSDPEWSLDVEDVERVLSIWRESAAAAQRTWDGPGLGYHGCQLRSPDGATWTARDGTVVGPGGVRLDPDRMIERVLRGSAPPGLVPALPGPP